MTSLERDASVELLLREAVDTAYRRARQEVFDDEPPGTEPSARTPRQQHLVASLERAEAALDEHRRGKVAALHPFRDAAPPTAETA